MPRRTSVSQCRKNDREPRKDQVLAASRHLVLANGSSVTQCGDKGNDLNYIVNACPTRDSSKFTSSESADHVILSSFLKIESKLRGNIVFKILAKVAR